MPGGRYNNFEEYTCISFLYSKKNLTPLDKKLEAKKKALLSRIENDIKRAGVKRDENLKHADDKREEAKRDEDSKRADDKREEAKRDEDSKRADDKREEAKRDEDTKRADDKREEAKRDEDIKRADDKREETKRYEAKREETKRDDESYTTILKNRLQRFLTSEGRKRNPHGDWRSAPAWRKRSA